MACHQIWPNWAQIEIRGQCAIRLGGKFLQRVWAEPLILCHDSWNGTFGQLHRTPDCLTQPDNMFIYPPSLCVSLPNILFMLRIKLLWQENKILFFFLFKEIPWPCSCRSYGIKMHLIYVVRSLVPAATVKTARRRALKCVPGARCRQVQWISMSWCHINQWHRKAALGPSDWQSFASRRNFCLDSRWAQLLRGR